MAESLPRSIVVLGPSGSGKSTLVNALREPGYADRVTIPKRVITLPVREDSDQVENENVSSEEFRERLEAGAIRPWWTRQLGGQAVHSYGFETVDPNEERIVVYPANNAMVRSASGNGVRELLARSEIALITADREAREGRLLERAPSMPEAEREARLDDEIDLILIGPNQGLELIDTSRLSMEDSHGRFMEFVLAGTAEPEHVTPAPAIVPTALPQTI